MRPVSYTHLFVRYVVKDDISHGVTNILYAISRRQGRSKRHNTWSSIIASSITIGFGGSVGAEAPIVLTLSLIHILEMPGHASAALASYPELSCGLGKTYVVRDYFDAVSYTHLDVYKRQPLFLY